jgi:hypothetical protein
MEDKIKKISDLILASNLDQTIKDILIRDLQADGLTDFLKEQIKAYCLDALKNINSQQEELDKLLSENNKNPA